MLKKLNEKEKNTMLGGWIYSRRSSKGTLARSALRRVVELDCVEAQTPNQGTSGSVWGF